jgi:diguanylate cyclase (GGDEF)-like protein
MLGQVLQTGRALFATRLCRVSESRHLKVDVHSMPIVDQAGRTCLWGRSTAPQQQRSAPPEPRVCGTETGGHTRRADRSGQPRATRDAAASPARGLSRPGRDTPPEYHLSGCRQVSTHVNDTYGHKVGDQVLVDLTRTLQNETYSSEVIGRYGGEEFVILCPDTDLDSAVRRAERLRHAIAKSSIGGICHAECDLLVWSFDGTPRRHRAYTLLERADTCLYRAKETGRNRTCWETGVIDPEARSEEGH